MVTFVNIKTKEVFQFDSWESIILKGGLKNCLPSDQWGDIWEHKAAFESCFSIIHRYTAFSHEEAAKAVNAFIELGFKFTHWSLAQPGSATP